MEKVFSGVTFTFEDKRFAYGEQRFITIGMLVDLIVVIAHTEIDEENSYYLGKKGNQE
jgi:uncharacterized DUF497 family protein